MLEALNIHVSTQTPAWAIRVTVIIILCTYSETLSLLSSSSSTPMFQVRSTPHAGRAVFATQPIPSGTSLLISQDLAFAVTYREYTKEVCHFCYAYDRGKHWGVRLPDAGLAWCSEECKLSWLEVYGGQVALIAHKAVEDLTRRKKRGQVEERDDGEKDEDEKEPTIEEVDLAWYAAGKLGSIIIESRSLSNPTKSQIRTISKLKSPDVGILGYQLASILSRSTLSQDEWNSILTLHPSSQPYPTTTILSSHINAYHHLLSILPLPLLPHVTPTTLRSIISRDAHNSFGIRSLDDGGSEMFGHGIWPSASYWNHSCSPCVTKQRIDRKWIFKTSRDIVEGEELCITYLGGDEKDLGVEERRDQLWSAWRFRCICVRCVKEGGE